jgi:hypothetical protein
VKPDIQMQLNMYEPLPTNRTRRSRLYAVKNSKVIKRTNQNHSNHSVNVNSLNHQNMMKKNHLRKN